MLLGYEMVLTSPRNIFLWKDWMLRNWARGHSTSSSAVTECDMIGWGTWEQPTCPQRIVMGPRTELSPLAYFPRKRKCVQEYFAVTLDLARASRYFLKYLQDVNHFLELFCCLAILDSSSTHRLHWGPLSWELHSDTPLPTTLNSEFLLCSTTITWSYPL